MAKNSIVNIHDIKETSKRATQFSYVAMVVASFTVITKLFDHNYLSAVLVTGLIGVLGILVWLNKTGRHRIVAFSFVVILNLFLVIISFAEGLRSSSTLYFLPLLFATPFFIENNSRYKRNMLFFFSVTLISFLTCILFCDPTSTWQHISDDVYRRMSVINSLCAFLLCAIFTALSIFLERRYARALLNQVNRTAEAMDARTRFLSNMGHELRTPLNGIIGATNLLRRGSSLPEQQEYLGILKYCSDHMLGLVNDILDFNKIEAGQLDLHPVECNLKGLLKQSTLPFYNSFEEKKLELKIIIDEDLDAVVKIDDLRLVQIINNLLSNALKFTEEGYVCLTVKNEGINNGLITIAFSVQDTGIGIKKGDQNKVFGSFWQAYNQTTRKYAGTGLGLTICQRLLSQMESKLMLDSEEGKGSRFYFTVTVPIVELKPENKAMPEQKQGDLSGLRILLAEDNIINALIAKKILEDKNAVVITAQNGQEALDRLEENGDYNLVLLDLEMPVMDGYSAVAAIRNMYPYLPVVAFTAALMDQDMYQDLIKKGFLDCILKPFQVLDFYAKVRKYALPVVELQLETV